MSGTPDPGATAGTDAGTVRPVRRSPRPAHVALVALGGAVGAPLRWGVAQVLPGPPGWPTATFVTNLVGAFAMGLLLEALARSGPEGPAHRRVLLGVRLAVGTGVIGAFTTYSTFVVEVDRLVAAGHAVTGGAYALASVAGGLLAAAAGVAVGSWRGPAAAARTAAGR